jgi:hypothetical protein
MTLIITSFQGAPKPRSLPGLPVPPDHAVQPLPHAVVIELPERPGEVVALAVMLGAEGDAGRVGGLLPDRAASGVVGLDAPLASPQV